METIGQTLAEDKSMTRDEIRSRLPILQAWLDGKEIEVMKTGSVKWETYEHLWRDAPDFFNSKWDFRIKAQPPKPREWWLVRYDNNHGYLVHDYSVCHVGMPGTEYIHVREVIDEKGASEEVPAPEGGT